MKTTNSTSLADSLAELGKGNAAEDWARVAELCTPALRQAARRALTDENLVEDAVQDALLEIRRQASGFVPKAEDAERAAHAWVAGIGYFSALRIVRKRRRDAAREKACPRVTANSNCDLPDVGMEVDRLPEHLRESLKLRYYEGLDYREAAAELQVPEPTLRKRVERGIALLRRRLSECTSLAVAFIGVRFGELKAKALALKGTSTMAKICAGSVAGIVAACAIAYSSGHQAKAEEKQAQENKTVVKEAHVESVAVSNGGEKYVFNGKEVTREEYERLSAEAKQSMADLQKRAADIKRDPFQAAESKTSSSESYVVNGKQVTKEEYERATAESLAKLESVKKALEAKAKREAADPNTDAKNGRREATYENGRLTVRDPNQHPAATTEK